MKAMICVFAVMAVAVPVTAQTYVTSHVVTSTTWNLAGSPYIIQGYIEVNGASLLTIDPGVIVRFAADATLEAQVGSSIVAVGTAGEPILFTSDSGTPAPGDWNFFGLDDAAASEFSHCVFEYGKYNLNIAQSEATVSFCTVRYSSVNGILCWKSAPTITNCTVVNNSVGIKIVGPDVSPVINYCNLYDNVDNLGLYEYEELPIVTINAENNWWGTDIQQEIEWTINIHPDAVGFVEVDFDPWLHDTSIDNSVSWARVKALFAD